MKKDKVLHIISYSTLPVFLLLCLFNLEYLNYGDIPDMWQRVCKVPPAFLFAVIITVLLSAVILLLVKRVWIYAVSFGSLTVIMGLINCIKHGVNGDYFFPWDVMMIGNTGQLLSFARFDIPPFFWLLLPLIAGFCVFYGIAGAKLPLRWYFRVPPAAAVIAAFIIMYHFPTNTEKVFRAFGMSFNNSILQSSNYHANGFVSAFTINCYAMKLRVPEGYSEEQLTGYLTDAEETEATSKPDVIVVLSEAYFDVTTLKDTEFSEDPLPVLHSLEDDENAFVGTLMTSALGGGTVRTEFEILTGLTVDYLTNGTSPYIYVTHPFENYVSNYKAQGYDTIALHTYDKAFYMRSSAYPLLGFDSFIGAHEIAKRSDASWRRNYITDATLVKQIEESLDGCGDKPGFVFAITMENHQSYTKSDPADVFIDVKNDRLSEDVYNSVVTYTQGAYYADAALGELIEYVKNRDKDTILLFFGDHLPTLGSNQLAYREAGNVREDGKFSKTDKMYLYATPFVFYNNFGADYASVLGDTDTVSPYYLLTLTAQLSGTGITKYMDYLSDNLKETPFYNVRLNNDISEESKEFINSMRLITYDRLRGQKYSEK